MWRYVYENFKKCLPNVSVKIFIQFGLDILIQLKTDTMMFRHSQFFK